jgi:hypothetical protein
MTFVYRSPEYHYQTCPHLHQQHHQASSRQSSADSNSVVPAHMSVSSGASLPGDSFPGSFSFLNRSQSPPQFSATSLSPAQSFPYSCPERPSMPTVRTYSPCPDDEEDDEYANSNSGQETNSDLNAAISNDEVSTCHTVHKCH